MRGEQMMSRGGQRMMSILRRWREMQLQRGWRTWMSVTFRSQLDEQRMDAGKHLLARTLRRWREMQQQRGFRTWHSVVFHDKVCL